MSDIRNLLIVGQTGSGKSALANVLSDTNNFEESSGSISKTKNFQSEPFEWKGTKYCVFDTIGIGDTKLSRAEILYKIAEGIYAMNGGVNQILFVVGDRFNQSQIDAFKMYRLILDESRILRYTTLVKTRFRHFRDSEKCRMDRESLIKENEEHEEIVNSFKKIIYVDNPPIDLEDEEKRINEKKRKDSREILLDFLRDECQANYELKCWSVLGRKFGDFIGKKLVSQNGKSEQNEGSLSPELEKSKQGLIKEIESAITNEIPTIKTRYWWQCQIL